MVATIIGGFFFVGSQAWEWSHFIHGSEFGKVELADGSQAIVKGHFGELENFTEALIMDQKLAELEK
jgi:cytochrome c oxidase subunit 3